MQRRPSTTLLVVVVAVAAVIAGETARGQQDKCEAASSSGPVVCAAQTNPLTNASDLCAWCFSSCHNASLCPSRCGEAQSAAECARVSGLAVLDYAAAQWPQFKVQLAGNAYATDSAYSAFVLASGASQSGVVSSRVAIPTRLLRTLDVTFEYQLAACGTYCADGLALFVADAATYAGTEVFYGASKFGVVGLPSLWTAAVFDTYGYDFAAGVTSIFYVLANGQTPATRTFTEVSSSVPLSGATYLSARVIWLFDVNGTATIYARISDGTTTQWLVTSQSIVFAGQVPEYIRVGISAGTYAEQYGTFSLRNVVIKANGDPIGPMPCTWISNAFSEYCSPTPQLGLTIPCSVGDSSVDLCESIDRTAWMNRGSAQIVSGDSTAAQLVDGSGQCGELATTGYAYSLTNMNFSIALSFEVSGDTTNRWACFLLAGYNYYYGSACTGGVVSPDALISSTAAWLGICLLPNTTTLALYNDGARTDKQWDVAVGTGAIDIMLEINITNTPSTVTFRSEVINVSRPASA